MKLWLDQMLPRRLCAPIQEWTGCETWHVGTTYPDDPEIFLAAREAGAILLTKDRDFPSHVARLGATPQIIWLTCGNCSNRELARLLQITLPEALALLQKGETIVEISGAQKPLTQDPV